MAIYNGYHTKNPTLDMDNIKVVVRDAEYYYNKNNVTCKADFIVRMPRALEDLIGWIEGTCSATAFCHSDDTYNKEVGEKIALAKAETRIYEGVMNEISKRIIGIKDTIDLVEPVVEKFEDKAIRSIDHNSDYIERISNSRSENMLPKYERLADDLSHISTYMDSHIKAVKKGKGAMTKKDLDDLKIVLDSRINNYL